VLSSAKVNTTLRPLLDEIKQALVLPPTGLQPSLIIVDDVSVMDWIGIPALEIQRFLRALSALCRKVCTYCYIHLLSNVDLLPRRMHASLSGITSPHPESPTICFVNCYNSLHTTSTYARYLVVVAERYRER
jgi:hypothetical protein